MTAATLRSMDARRLLQFTALGWGVALPVLFLAFVGLMCIHTTDRTIDDQSRSALAAGEGAAPGAAAFDSGAPLAGAPSLWQRFVRAVGPLTLRQLVFLVSGVGIMLLMLWPGYQKIGRRAYYVYWFVIALLVLLVLDHYVDLPLIPVKRATRRWIEFGGIGVQPSEFMKPALMLALARYLRYRKSYRHWWGLLPPFLMTLLPMVLILKQPDLGTLLMLLPVLFVMLFVAGARLSHLAIIVALGLATLPLFYVFGMRPYQRDRIDMVLRQNTEDIRWHMDKGYQLFQSKIALGSGGLLGEGYGEGMFVRYELLPEEHNDFIFAIIGNQFGFVGALLVILAYALIVLFGIEVSTATNDPFGRLIAIGVVVMIVMQAYLNMAMTIGLAPITGMPLPFVSYGGSSLWANFIGLGLLVNVAQRRPMLIARKPFQHAEDA